MNITDMMNHTDDGWLDLWMGPEMWIWMVAVVLMVVLLALAIIKLSKK